MSDDDEFSAPVEYFLIGVISAGVLAFLVVTLGAFGHFVLDVAGVVPGGDIPLTPSGIAIRSVAGMGVLVGFMVFGYVVETVCVRAAAWYRYLGGGRS